MADLKNERIQLRALENLFAQKRFPEALTFAEKLIGDYPNSYHIGIIYVKTLKELNRLKEAEAAALKLMRLSPDNINLLLELGTIYLKLNKYDQSYDYYNKVLFLDPFNNEARESMDKIKDFKKISGGDDSREKKLIDFSTEPEAEEVKSDMVPELEEEQISPLNLGVAFESIEPEETTSEPLEFVEPLIPNEISEPLEPVEPTEPTEPTELSELNELNEPIPKSEIAQESSASTMLNFEREPEFAETAAPTGMAEVEMVTEPGDMAEIPGVMNVTEEVDAVETQPDPYAQFYNEETVESEEEVTLAPGEIGEASKAGEATEFVTESAAALYLTQGLYDDALRIYEKLYVARKEGRILLKVKQLKAHRAGLEKIRRLNEFLKLIQMKGE